MLKSKPAAESKTEVRHIEMDNNTQNSPKRFMLAEKQATTINVQK